MEGCRKLGSELGGPERGTHKLSVSFGVCLIGIGRVDEPGIDLPARRLEQKLRKVRSSPLGWGDAGLNWGDGTPVDSVDVSDPSRAVRLRRVGILGGTFDPIHVGHLVTAVNVRHALALDRVILMVANVPWQKEGQRSITPALDRLAMVRAAVEGVEGLEAGRLEIDRGGPSYTADTLAELARLEGEVELFTIVGDDAAAGIHSWERVGEVLAMSTMVVVDRPGARVELPSDVDWVRVEVPRLDVSSTDLRARFRDGRPLDYLITEPVLDVIRARGLYVDEEPS